MLLGTLLQLSPPTSSVAAESGWGQFVQDLKTLGRAISGESEPEPVGADPVPKSEPLPLFVDPPVPAPRRIVKPKPTAEVAEAQGLLNRIGYDAGPEDGLMGPRTRSALEAFQGEHELPVTGRTDEATRTWLQRLAGAGPGLDSLPPVAQATGMKEDATPDVRAFDFRGVRLGASIDEVRSVFSEVVVRAEEQSIGTESHVESYFGIDYQGGMSFRFDRQSRLFRVNSTQVLDRSVTPRVVYERFAKKYGPANAMSEFREDGQQGRFRWSTRQSVGEATLEVTIHASAAENLTRIHATLRDEGLARENREALSRAVRASARNRPAARDVQL